MKICGENNGLKSNELKGYRGSTYELLKQINASIGDMIEITKNGENYQGGLMPRSESGDDQHIVIKIKSGYNIGVKIDSTTKIGEKDAVYPIISGQAWITGTHQHTLDPTDPWPEGYRLTDTWPKMQK